MVVIGAGPAGEAAAELGGNLGYPVALVERDTVGGTVVTSGGAPTKTFREAAAYQPPHPGTAPLPTRITSTPSNHLTHAA